MSYSDLKNKVNQYNESSTDYHLKQNENLRLLAEHIEKLEKSRDVSLEYLYSDIIQIDCGFSFQKPLGNPKYINACNYSTECIEISFHCRNLLPKKAETWTLNALKCFDHLLVHYVSNVLNETVIPSGRSIKETDVYSHFEKKGGDYTIIGTSFKTVYQKRNEFTHILYTEKDGKVQIRNLSNKQRAEKLNVIIDFFKKGLDLVLPLYKNHYVNN